jgi:hypothetical protein
MYVIYRFFICFYPHSVPDGTGGGAWRLFSTNILSRDKLRVRLLKIIICYLFHAP